MAVLIIAAVVCLLLLAFDILAWALVALLVGGVSLLAWSVLGENGLATAAALMIGGAAAYAAIRYLARNGTLWVLVPVLAGVVALPFAATLWMAADSLGRLVIASAAVIACTLIVGISRLAAVGRRVRLQEQTDGAAKTTSGETAA